MHGDLRSSGFRLSEFASLQLHVFPVDSGDHRLSASKVSSEPKYIPQGPGGSDEPAAARPIFDGAEMREAFNKVRLNSYLYAP